MRGDRQSGVHIGRTYAFKNCRLTGFSNKSEMANVIVNVLSGRRGGHVVAINAEKFVALRRDKGLQEVVDSAYFNYPDGIGAVFALWTKGIRSARVPGSDVWLQVLRSAERIGEHLQVALVGASPEVLSKAVAVLEKNYPASTIVLARDGYDGIADLNELQEALTEAQPNLVFVALGSPKQEYLMANLRQILPGAFFMGLGGSLDVLVGEVRRAPRYLREYGFEWLYRLVRQPSRIVRQRRLVVFIVLLFLGRI